MEKHKPINQKDSNREISPVKKMKKRKKKIDSHYKRMEIKWIKQGHTHTHIHTHTHKKKLTMKKCVSPTIKIPKLHRFYATRRTIL